MKTKILFIAIIFLAVGCGSRYYVPSFNDIKTNTFGARIEVTTLDNIWIEGELISADINNIVVLRDDSLKCELVPLRNIKNFKIEYARGKFYGWSIPVFAAFGLSHGMNGILTIPINLISTISITAGGANAFTYLNNVPTDSLFQFARFPGGIPKGIDTSSIK